MPGTTPSHFVLLSCRVRDRKLRPREARSLLRGQARSVRLPPVLSLLHPCYLGAGWAPVWAGSEHRQTLLHEDYPIYL